MEGERIREVEKEREKVEGGGERERAKVEGGWSKGRGW